MKDDGEVLLEPKAILDFHWPKSSKKILQEALVHWVGTVEEYATWKLLLNLQQQFPRILRTRFVFKGKGMLCSRDTLEGSAMF